MWQETARQIQAQDPHLNAWVCWSEAQMADQAQGCRARGIGDALLGVPVGVKDAYNTALFPTRMGSSCWGNPTPGNDARLVHHLRLEGAIIAGKTVTAEFATHELTQQRTRHPLDPTRIPGTSSSGSAVAVATGMVPLALGTQTAGSVIRPASFTGVCGMKPSYGLLPRTGVLKTTDTLDTMGFFTAFPQDLRLLLNVLRVRGPNYPKVAATLDAQAHQPFPKTLRVGVLQTESAPWEAQASDWVARAWTALQGRLASLPADTGLTFVPVTLPDRVRDVHAIHERLYCRSLAYYFTREAQRAETGDLSPVFAAMMTQGKAISLEQYEADLAWQEHWVAYLEGWFASSAVDAVMTTATLAEAPVNSGEEPPDSCLVWTFGHVPSVTVPAFRSPTGMPAGVQVVSSRYGDLVLLEVVQRLVASGVLEAP
jgi:Asp-tRNA(Asn)/Glu-tRNA(Gln) amidotransferase A subunit family amidase